MELSEFFPHDYTGFVGYWEENCRSKVPYSSLHIMDTYCQHHLFTGSVDLELLGWDSLSGFSTVNFMSPSHFSYCTIWNEVTVNELTFKEWGFKHTRMVSPL